jgi:hypothetical protein
VSEGPTVIALLVVVAVALAAVGVRARRRRGAATEIPVRAAPDEALLASAAALRRTGARITRYDPEEGTLEARPAGAPESRVRVRVTPADADTARLRIESDPAGGRALIRRFRAELGG